MLLKDKIVVISGIGPGMGSELALIAAAEGAKVVLGARTESYLKDVAGQITKKGGEAIWRKTDITKEEDCQGLAKAAVDKWGRIDGLVNSGYTGGNFAMFEDADFADWKKTLEVNLFGTLQMTRAVVPTMKKQKRGAIVNVNTMVQKKPLPMQAGYGTSKAALEGATRFLAAELGPYGIRVNSTRMGWMWGPPVAGFFERTAKDTGQDIETLKAPILQNIPLGVIPDDADCAKAVLMLISDFASVVTGAVLDVNGGEYMP